MEQEDEKRLLDYATPDADTGTDQPLRSFRLDLSPRRVRTAIISLVVTAVIAILSSILIFIYLR